MERALLLDTERVRFDEAVGAGLAPGRTTAECVHHGIALAQCGAVRLALEQAAASGPSPALFFTGGGGRELESLCAVAGSRYLEDLVFEGLEVLAAEAGLPVAPTVAGNCR
jgi:type III pantothenate kinase